uniref:Uncharacterized protein n=1 Tax=Amphimedon queenslandica TaxID=400682 RepID=A0A1X7VT58_AMPQE
MLYGHRRRRFVLHMHSKSSTISLVSSIPFLLPTAQTNLCSLHLTRHTTPPGKII